MYTTVYKEYLDMEEAMTDAVLERIWETLVRCCGAKPDGLEDFLFATDFGEEHHRVTEYRFIGSLGFGGKVWIKPGKAPYVTCYQEDTTPARSQAMAVANNELQKLWEAA